MSFESAIIAQLRKRIDARSSEIINHIVSGQCVDHSEYRYYCGMLLAFDEVAKANSDTSESAARCMIDQIIIDANKG